MDHTMQYHLRLILRLPYLRSQEIHLHAENVNDALITGLQQAGFQSLHTVTGITITTTDTSTIYTRKKE